MREEENEIRGEKLNLGDEVQTFISLCRHVSVDSARQWSSLETCAFQVIINIDSTITSVEVGGGDYYRASCSAVRLSMYSWYIHSSTHYVFSQLVRMAVC